MGRPSKSWPIDAAGRVLMTELGINRVETAELSIGTTPVTIATGASDFARRKLFIRNFGLQDEVLVYVGGADVTPESGYPLYVGGEIEIDVDGETVVKAVRGSGDSDGEIRIMEIQ